MFVKQIDMAKALELAAKGMEIKVLAPIGQEDGWENLVPDTLQHMLEGVIFFRQEPALEKEILPVVSREEPEPPAEKSLSDLTKELKQARPQKGKLDVDIGKMKALREADRPPENVVMFRRMIKSMCTIFHLRILGKVTIVDEKGRRW